MPQSIRADVLPCPAPQPQSSSTAVVYECAVTLVSLSSAPTAVRAAANCYCQLLVSQSDNNVKLIVLDRLVELKTKHREVRRVFGIVASAAYVLGHADGHCKYTTDQHGVDC
jgi:vesicle coat complex subunit